MRAAFVILAIGLLAPAGATGAVRTTPLYAGTDGDGGHLAPEADIHRVADVNNPPPGYVRERGDLIPAPTGQPGRTPIKERGDIVGYENPPAPPKQTPPATDSQALYERHQAESRQREMEIGR